MDYAAFGQTVITVEKNRMLDGLLYRNWHLRDVAWAEDDELKIDLVHHNWMREARNLHRVFGDKVAANVKTTAEKEPFKKIKCRQIVIPEDEYDQSVEKKGRTNRMPFCSILIDVENETILEEVPQPRHVVRDPALADGVGLALRLFAGDGGGASRRAHAAGDDADAAGSRAEARRSAAEGHQGCSDRQRQSICRLDLLGRQRI